MLLILECRGRFSAYLDKKEAIASRGEIKFPDNTRPALCAFALILIISKSNCVITS